MCVLCIYICIYGSNNFCFIYIYIYIYIYVCVCVCVCVYTCNIFCNIHRKYFLYLCLSVSVSLCLCLSLSLYIYIYIYRCHWFLFFKSWIKCSLKTAKVYFNSFSKRHCKTLVNNYSWEKMVFYQSISFMPFEWQYALHSLHNRSLDFHGKYSRLQNKLTRFRTKAMI